MCMHTITFHNIDKTKIIEKGCAVIPHLQTILGKRNNKNERKRRNFVYKSLLTSHSSPPFPSQLYFCHNIILQKKIFTVFHFYFNHCSLKHYS